jgi:hypothetical protein
MHDQGKNPTPRVDEMFDHLQGATHFTLGIRSGYYQNFKDGDVAKTCIRTRYGFFEFLVMQIGITNAMSVPGIHELGVLRSRGCLCHVLSR